MRKRATIAAAGIAAGIAAGLLLASPRGRTGPAFSPLVDAAGGIHLPEDIPPAWGWSHLGTYVVTARPPEPVPPPPSTAPEPGIHVVYARAEAILERMKTGRWPDGTALIMETRAAATIDLPTGRVLYPGDLVGRFVMVRDEQDRFPRHPAWAEGWGWALFRPGLPAGVAVEARKDCVACHEPARSTGLVFEQGYPVLTRTG